jgi:hypothetical protein
MRVVSFSEARESFKPVLDRVEAEVERGELLAWTAAAWEDYLVWQG